MKAFFHSTKSAGTRHGRLQALTLVEMMVTMSIFTFCVLGFIYLHIFGLRQQELVNSKLGASDQSRAAFGQMMEDIRSAQAVNIGDVSGGSFSGLSGTGNQGTAIQLIYNTANNSSVYYYLDSTGTQLRRTTQASPSSSDPLVARYLTNSVVFRTEDYQGTPTSANFVYLVHVILQFYQYQYPMTKVGSQYYYDYYKLEFKAAPRNR